MVGDFHRHGRGPLELYLALKGVHGAAGAKHCLSHAESIIDRLVGQELQEPGSVYLDLAKAAMAKRGDRYKTQTFCDDRDQLVGHLMRDLTELRRLYREQWGRDTPMPTFPVLECARDLATFVKEDILLSTPRPRSKGRGRLPKTWLPALHRSLTRRGITAREDRVALLDAVRLTEHYHGG